MTDDQIRRIMARLDQQDAEALEYRKEREALDEERLKASWKVYTALQESNKNFHQDNENIHKEIQEIKLNIQPLLDLANSVKGFDRIGMWIVKFLLGLGALIGAGGTILYFIRKLIIPNE